MSKWTTRIGYFLIVVGLAMLTPIGDFVPVDFWHSPGNDSAYLKVVPVSRTHETEIVLIGIGLVLIILGKVVSRETRTHT